MFEWSPPVIALSLNFLKAYMLYKGGGDGDSGSGNQSNPFKTTVIDTIVAEVQSVPGEDRCVLLLGYTDEMTEMFRVRRLAVALFLSVPS